MTDFLKSLWAPSSLWASLIGLIVVALAVVLIFNALQGRQRRQRDAIRRKAVQSESQQAATVSHRAEPSLGSPPARAGVVPAAPRPAARPDRLEPTLDDPEVDAAALIDPAASASVAPSAGAPAPRQSAGGLIDRAFQAGMAAAPARVETAPVRADAATSRADAGVNAAAGGTLTTASEAVEPPERPAPFAELPLAVLDPHIDCVVEVRLTAPVTAERLAQAAGSLRRAGSKPVLIEVDTDAGQWLVLHAATGPVRRLRVGLLLANRHGPLNAMEFSEFSDAVQAFSQAIGAAETRLPDMAPVLEHARQVDEFCAQLDTLIGINVQTPQALSPAELGALATSLGLTARGNNRYSRLGPDGEVLFSMALGERAEQITLLLDVPRAAPDSQPWAAMVDCGRRCAEATGGRLVDDALSPLTDAAVTAVARQLESHYRSLEDAGLRAGSVAALRVFN